MTKPKIKPVKAWAVIQDGHIVESYSLSIHLEKGRAMACKIMQHADNIIPVLISPLKKKK